MLSDTRAVSPSVYARSRGISVHKVLAFIDSGELQAINLASNLSGRPRWKLTPEAIADFERRRRRAAEAHAVETAKKQEGYYRDGILLKNENAAGYRSGGPPRHLGIRQWILYPLTEQGKLKNSSRGSVLDVFNLTSLPSTAWRIVQSDDLQAVLDAIAELEAKDGKGVFWGINPMLLNVNRHPQNIDIAQRQLLFLDVDDPDHAAKIPANEVGKKASRMTFDKIISDLATREWPAPVKVDSGNGHAAFFPIDLPNDDETSQLVSEFLHALHSRFGPLVDTGVGDARAALLGCPAQ